MKILRISLSDQKKKAVAAAVKHTRNTERSQQNKRKNYRGVSSRLLLFTRWRLYVSFFVTKSFAGRLLVTCHLLQNSLFNRCTHYIINKILLQHDIRPCEMKSSSRSFFKKYSCDLGLRLASRLLPNKKIPAGFFFLVLAIECQNLKINT